jgi:hypothetical protein
MTEGHRTRAKQPSASHSVPEEFVQMGGKPLEALIKMQMELLDSFDEANRAWVARVRLQAVLGVELFNKLTAARSMPAAAAAYRECMNQHLDMLAEDGRRILEDSKRLLRSSTGLFANGASGPRRKVPAVT